MPRGSFVEMRAQDGRQYELWRTNCNKKTCTKCPHGPYWFLVSFATGKKRLLYQGANLPAIGEAPAADSAGAKPPYKCDCGSRLGDAQRLAGSCPKCRAELDPRGFLVRCKVCNSGLKRFRLDSDPCHICGEYGNPPADQTQRIIQSIIGPKRKSGR